MTMIAIAPVPPTDPGATRSVGDGRYRLTATDPGPGPVPAVDSRLGRRVLVQHGSSAGPDATAARLLRVDHPTLARLLDAGEDVVAGRRRPFLVYPATDLPPFAASDPARWADLDLRAVAGLAAWAVAGACAVAAAGLPNVAPCADDVVVDTADLLDPTTCPLRWMPGPGPRPDGLAHLVAALAASRGRRGRRPLAGVVDLLTTPYGRLQAVRQLADTAGVDPRVLGVLPRAPRHAGPERRLFGRRSLVGSVPTTKRREVPCGSVEACS